MPNWTGNTITLEGKKESRETFKERVKGENGAFDFNRIMEMPRSLDITCGSQTKLGMACYDEKVFKEYSSYPWFPERYPNVTTPEQLRTFLSEQNPEAVKLGKQAVDNIRLYGVPTWYEWRNEHWATKWNACEIKVEEYDDVLTYYFDTAWDSPRPLIEPIVQLAQELGLSIIWDADHEDGGYESIYDSDTDELEVA